MRTTDELNPTLSVSDLKNSLENTTFSLTCASLKRFAKLEKDVLCTTNVKFKEKCPNYCADAVDVPVFALNRNETTSGTGDTSYLRSLPGSWSYMLMPSERLKTITYAHVVELDECKKKCIENAGCECNLVTFNSETKECTIDCPTLVSLEKNAHMTSVQFVRTPNDATELASFEKIRRP
jgi:hypothetical protein